VVVPPNTTIGRSYNSRSDALVYCCVLSLMMAPSSATHLTFIFILDEQIMMCLLLSSSFIDWCPHDLNTSPLHRRVDCYVCEVLLQQHKLYPPLEHISCAQVGGGASLVHSHQTISVVLMAESPTSIQSPATADVADDVGWL
jgi:hypothetical protein